MKPRQRGLAFHEEKRTPISPPAGGGSGGRGGQTGQGGRGTGGRGRGSRAQEETTGDTHHTDDMHGDGDHEEHVRFLLDNELDEIDDAYLCLSHSAKRDCGDCFTTAKSGFPADSLLLDTGSTVNIVSNRSLLTDIHPAKRTMRVRCSAGVRVLDQMGWLGSYPTPVWYDPHGIANLLSFHDVQATTLQHQVLRRVKWRIHHDGR